MEITAKILAHSTTNEYGGIELITVELTYPRIVHSEFLTHRAFSRAAASSRAIPFAKMEQQLEGMPTEFGRNQSGMQSAGEHNALIRVKMPELVGKAFPDEGGEAVDMYVMQEYDFTPEEAWEGSKIDAVKWSKAFCEAGYHKQNYNRLTEPYQMIKVVVTATEWDNFFWLRDHEAADPTLSTLATKMRQAIAMSTPKVLEYGQWHLPYVDVPEGHNWSDEEATGNLIKMSVARCAAVSFRNEDYDLEKSLDVFARLIGSDRKHASALEHIATPIRPAGYYSSEETISGTQRVNHSFIPFTWDNGITHVGRDGVLWSGNFKGWLQFRQTMKDHTYYAK